MSFQPNPPPDPAAQWRKIQHIGLCPGILSFEIYTDTYVPQLEQAINESIAVACLVPGLDEIRAFHKIVFNGIHEWAGTFRGAGESVNFDGGQIGADHHRIVPAIEKVQAETTTLIETSANIGEKVRAVVMYLGALRCIHPFRVETPERRSSSWKDKWPHCSVRGNESQWRRSISKISFGMPIRVMSDLWLIEYSNEKDYLPWLQKIPKWPRRCLRWTSIWRLPGK